MYRKVPAEMLMKKAMMKFPWSMSNVPVTSPKMFMHPWTNTIIVEVLFEYPYFLYIRPKVKPSAHLCTNMALAKLMTPIGVFCNPTARH